MLRLVNMRRSVDLDRLKALQGDPPNVSQGEPKINLKFNGRVKCIVIANCDGMGLQKVAMKFPHHKCIQILVGRQVGDQKS